MPVSIQTSSLDPEAYPYRVPNTPDIVRANSSEPNEPKDGDGTVYIATNTLPASQRAMLPSVLSYNPRVIDQTELRRIGLIDDPVQRLMALSQATARGLASGRRPSTDVPSVDPATPTPPAALERPPSSGESSDMNSKQPMQVGPVTETRQSVQVIFDLPSGLMKARYQAVTVTDAMIVLTADDQAESVFLPGGVYRTPGDPGSGLAKVPVGIPHLGKHVFCYIRDELQWTVPELGISQIMLLVVDN